MFHNYQRIRYLIYQWIYQRFNKVLLKCEILFIKKSKLKLNLIYYYYILAILLLLLLLKIYYICNLNSI